MPPSSNSRHTPAPDARQAEIKEAEKRGYARGYVAGRKRVDADRLDDLRVAHQAQRRHDVFCAALTGLLASPKVWSAGKRTYKDIDDYVELASDFARKAVP